MPVQLSAAEALARLVEGNRRYAGGSPCAGAATLALRVELASGQQPFAAVLGCSDSRVPAELVFDCGLGELFVIRVAGNVVAPSQIGSVEFAVERFGTRLVVVLGHTRCGAIDAAIESFEETAPPTAGLRSIVSRVRPALAPLLATELARDRDALARAAVRANVLMSVAHLRSGSPILERLVAKDGLLVAGAEYDLERGLVDFFEVPPPDALSLQGRES